MSVGESEIDLELKSNFENHLNKNGCESSVGEQNPVPETGAGADCDSGDSDSEYEIYEVKPKILDWFLKKCLTYFYALRPYSLSASFIPVMLGITLAAKDSIDSFNCLITMLTLFTVISVHGAVNVVNTYFDYVKGIDAMKSADDRVLVDRMLTTDQVVQLAAFLYFSGIFGFVLLSLVSPCKFEFLAAIFFCGLSSSFLYTGGIGLKYIALGDVLVLLMFGPLSVLFAHMAHSGHFDSGTVFYPRP